MMMRPCPHTAIFILARNEAAEARCKSLTGKGAQADRDLIRRMNRETAQLAHSIGVRVFHIDGELASKETFGEKLESAFTRVFHAGFDRVIAIGNDCPSLSRRRLLNAVEQLRKHDFVIGPAKDGGVYLIGAQKDAFSGAALRNLPWLTGRLFEAMQKTWKTDDLYILPAEHDLDEHADLSRLLRTREMNSFIRSIRRMLIRISSPVRHPGSGLANMLHHFMLQLRGPPLQS